MSRASSPLLIIKPADGDGSFRALDVADAQLALSEVTLQRLEYRLISWLVLIERQPSLYAKAASPELSDRAWQVLYLVAAHVADVCPLGMEPCTANTLAAIASMSVTQLASTLSGLLRQRLVAPWAATGSRLPDTRYVPTISGMIALGDDAPTPEGSLTARRLAILVA